MQGSGAGHVEGRSAAGRRGVVSVTGRVPSGRRLAWHPRKAVSAAALAAAVLVVVLLAAGCGSGVGGAIKSAAASLTASGRPPAAPTTEAAAPTTAPPPTTAPAPPPTTAPAPPPTTAPAPATTRVIPVPVTTTATPSPATSATPAASTEPTSPLLWLWLALGALAFIGIIWWISHASARRRAAKAGWRSQVIEAYSAGAALQDAMSTAEAPGALDRPDASARWADIQRRADDLNQKLYAMREAAPDEQARARIVDVITSLQAVRSAMDAERAPGGASGPQAEVVRHRLLAFETSLRALRSPAEPQY